MQSKIDRLFYSINNVYNNKTFSNRQKLRYANTIEKMIPKLKAEPDYLENKSDQALLSEIEVLLVNFKKITQKKIELDKHNLLEIPKEY
jgi:hypothetical protein